MSFQTCQKNYGRTWGINELKIAVKKGDITVDEFVQITSQSPEALIETIDTIKARKLNELSNNCEETIVGGVDVTTTMGVEHFSLELTDQMEITNQFSAVLTGETSVLYHADGNGGNCRLFSAAEMTAIATTAKAFVTYNRTYYNELKAWVVRSTTIEAVNAIAYGSPLPQDLDDHLVLLTSQSSIA